MREAAMVWRRGPLRVGWVLLWGVLAIASPSMAEQTRTPLPPPLPDGWLEIEGAQVP